MFARSYTRLNLDPISKILGRTADSTTENQSGALLGLARIYEPWQNYLGIGRWQWLCVTPILPQTSSWKPNGGWSDVFRCQPTLQWHRKHLITRLPSIKSLVS